MPRLMTTNTTGNRRQSRRVPAIVSALLATLVTLVGLAIGPSAVQAGTWTVYPNVVNNTNSTVDNCPAGVAGQGCIFRDSLGIIDGQWTKSPVPALPASANLNGDKSTFIAPNFAEGADGLVAYRMPDGSQYSLVAEDDQGITDALNQAYPGCGVSPGGGPNGFTCLASYGPLKRPGQPPSDGFAPNFMFYANDGSAPYTAAGQVCTTTGNSVLCAAGMQCNTSGFPACGTRTPSAPVSGQWSPTDPNNWMWLNLKNIGETGVTVTNQGSWMGLGPRGVFQCVMGPGDTCALRTSGGCAESTRNCGSDALQMAVNDGQSGGSVMVMQQAEIPMDMAEDWGAEFDSAIEGSIWAAVPDVGSSDSAPRITKLRASTAATRAKVKTGPEVRVSYRNSREARSVLTVARERTGVRRGARCVARTAKTPKGAKSCKRWVNLPGVGTKTSSRFVWTPSKGKACSKPATGDSKRGCRRATTLRGHQQNRDRAGVNRVTISRVGGKRLAPGRYRLTARSLAGRVKGPSASTTFRIGSGS